MRTCVTLVCVWGVVTTLASLPQHDSPLAQDCVIYDDQSLDHPSIPHKTFNQRISFGITAHNNPAWQLRLQSPATNATCEIFFVAGKVVATCGEKDVQVQWPDGIMEDGKTTDFWIQVVDKGQKDSLASSSSASSLLLVGKNAGKRGQLLFPSSGLLSPITLQFTLARHLQYFFNCVTGCLYGKWAETQPSDFNFYLRPGPGFLHLTLTYSVDGENDSFLNVTANDLGPIEGKEVKTVTVLLANGGTELGAFVNNKIVGKPGQRGKQKNAIKAEVVGEGMVSSCEQIFQGVAGELDDAGDGNEQVTSSIANQTTPRPDHVSSSANTDIILGCLLPITLLLLILLAILLFIFFGKHRIVQRISSSRRNSSRQVSLTDAQGQGSFTDSKHQGSFKDSKRQGSNRNSKHKVSLRDTKRKGDDVDGGSCSEVTALSDTTTMTPMNTPGSLSVPRSPNMVNSKEFVSLELE